MAAVKVVFPRSSLCPPDNFEGDKLKLGYESEFELGAGESKEIKNLYFGKYVEVDFTLCDLAADLRAATPTEAAQLAVPERRNQTRELHKQSLTLQQHMTRHLEDAQETYDRIIISPPWQMPAKMLQRADEHLHHSTHILTKNLQHRFADIKASCMLSIEMLDKLSPLKVLTRGYSILEKTFVSLPTTVNSIEAVELGEELAARLVDGDLTLYVTHKEHKQREKL